MVSYHGRLPYMPTQKLRHGRKEYGVEDEAGNWLIEPSATTKGATRVAAARLAERRGESVYVIEVGEDRDGGSRIVVDREEIRPPAEPPRSRAQIKREIDEVLARKPGAVQGHQGAAKAQPYEGMPVSVTKIGAARHGLRVGSQGIIKRVASADRRFGPPSTKASVLVSVHGAEFSSPWPTDALKLGRPKLAEEDGSARPISRRKNVRHFSETTNKKGVTRYFVTYEDRSIHEITPEELRRFRQHELERG